jgi:arylsulfatase
MRISALLAFLGAVSCASPPAAPPYDGPPNLLLILADDLGYGDLGSFGARRFRTPNLDRLAREGTRFTDFYVAQAVCSASRAALLTGCYANRVGLQGALNHQSRVGIHEDEVLLSELCKAKGYATAVFGKWHLGLQDKFLPARHGFDEYFGIPYSNDNGPLHPVMRDIPSIPLFDGEKVVATDPDQRLFTRWITERALSFMARNRARPFFLYLPHVMPHVPLHVSEGFRGRSGAGLYGDVIEELDASVGELLSALRNLGLEERTLVVFLSDNGPFLSYGTHSGSAGPLREGKLTTWDGGVRVPSIMRWPGRIPSGRVSAEPAATIDLFPTFAGLLGAPLPSHPIDGKDLWPVLSGRPGARSPQEAYYFYAGEELQALRSGEWKLHLPHDYLTVAGPTRDDGKPANWGNLKPAGMDQSGIRGIATRHGYRVERTGLALYNLREDAAESRNVADRHPEVVRRLEALAERMRAELGDSITGRVGSGVRPPGKL